MAAADAQLVFKYKGDTSQAQKSVGKLGATLKKSRRNNGGSICDKKDI